ncbi:DUF3363 domain-containing protein [Govanella unica]|uniref:DUF3363 domain-containing protein n=1 Tax=Govanella unica TaxID=2975056 RepID=A0A9X3Z718_9PROT|nr:DUF3363 domain-containing protein [Govania unica]MDA5193697.1 DUF3363 domain-containing protein [Govania unica]
MSDRDDRFKPELGRIRSVGRGCGRPYLNRVLKEMSVAGLAGLSGHSFSGYRIGRGNDAGRHERAGYRPGPAYRRVIIKTRLVRLSSGRQAAVRAHLRYIQRDGVSRTNDPGELYDCSSDAADGKAFLDRGEGDRHQFRFIVSAEDAAELDDQKPFIRDLMAAMEKDLGTRLDWVAVDHFNTDNPHTHILLRGKDERGQDLIIARDYIREGMRRRASELITLELGPQTELEIRRKLERQVAQDRFTDLDRDLLRSAADGIVDLRAMPEPARDRHKRLQKIGRLQVLAERGLALEIKTGRWTLSPKLEETLRQAGERGDIIKTMHRALADQKQSRAIVSFDIHHDISSEHPMTGLLIGKGVAGDGLGDRLHLVIDGSDGRVHYLELPEAACGDIPRGSLVEVVRTRQQARAADRTIADLARQNESLYEPAVHLLMARERIPVPGDNHEGYVEAHVRRLEALRRTGIVERLGPDCWRIPEDYELRAEAHDRSRNQQVRLRLLCPIGLETQITANAATWLDRAILDPGSFGIRDGGFGREVLRSMEHRKEWLAGQGLLHQEADRWIPHRNFLTLLARRELEETGRGLEQMGDLPFRVPENGERVRGIYRQSLTLVSGKYALIEGTHEINLVPWRPVIERELGRHVSGIVHGDGVSWKMGRGRDRGPWR